MITSSTRQATECASSTRPSDVHYPTLADVPEAERAAIRVSACSCYGDDRWNFDQEMHRHEAGGATVHFDKFELLDGSLLTDPENAGYLSIYKELLYSFITDPPRTRPKLSSVLSAVKYGPKSLIQYMHDNRIGSLADLGAVDMERFLAWIAALPHGHRAGDRVSDNAMKQRVMSLHWVYEQRHKMAAGLQINPWESRSVKQWVNGLKGALRRTQRTREIPDEVARQLVSQAMEVLRSVENYRRARTAYLARTHRAQREFDWQAHGFADRRSWKRYPSQLAAACYIIIALFSGMRCSEVLVIRSIYTDSKTGTKIPCKEIKEVQVDGGLKRCHFVYSMTKKLTPVPVLTKWQVAPIVFDAIDALLQGREHYRRLGDYLFASRTQSKGTGRLERTAISTSLRSFVREKDIRWHGQLWPIASHQFRKKFARMLVRQGLGIRELQDQLKHVDIEMTKVYGDPELYGELQLERFAVSKEKYEELLSGSFPIIGGGAEEIETLRAQFKGRTRADRRRMLDSLAKNALIDAVDFGFCLYNPRRAKCGGNRADCKPADCLNSVIPLETALRMLRARRAGNDQLMKEVRSPLARAHIAEQSRTIESLLAQAGTKGMSTTAELKESWRNLHA